MWSSLTDFVVGFVWGVLVTLKVIIPIYKGFTQRYLVIQHKRITFKNGKPVVDASIAYYPMCKNCADKIQKEYINEEDHV